MKLKRLFTLALVLAFVPPVWGEDERLERLSSEHRKWLEEEVVYIILDKEKEVFLSLETLEERERFIEAFWRHRDPNPATPENEFKTEHYRRLEYANEFLGRETSLPGWRTDRGHMYILLGEPQSIQRFEGRREIYPVHLWFYEGDISKGVPPFFQLLFWKPRDVGAYELYDPALDGPHSLFRHAARSGGMDPENLDDQFKQLWMLSPDLAQASLSLDATEPLDPANLRPHLTNTVLMANIYDVPRRNIRPDYATAWLEHGNRVSMEYSFNFVPSRSTFAVLNGPDGTPFVSYSVEIDPNHFTVETNEDQTRFYTTLDITAEARSQDGVLVYSQDKVVYVELSPREMEQFKAFPFSYQDNFPLVPGEYTVSVILRNRVVRQYTLAERQLVVDAVDAGEPALGDTVLGYMLDRTMHGDVAPEEIRTFQIGHARIHPANDGLFSVDETVHLLTQVSGAGPDFKLRMAIENGPATLDQRTRNVADYHGGPVPVIEEFPLKGLAGGRYTVRVRLLDGAGRIVDEESAQLQVSPRPGLPRPWVQFQSFNTRYPGLLPLARSEQLLALGRKAEARRELEAAVAADNGLLPNARWRLALIVLESGEADRALELLAPLEGEFPEQYDVMAGLGFAYHLNQDFAKAESYLERARKLRPPDTTLLNVLGDCYIKAGKPAQAAEAFARSLELNPDQELIKESLATLSK